MLATTIAGRGAAARKYDLLTALAISGLSGSPGYRVSILRLIALVTARYNWRLDEVSVGHDELARLWDVDPRTVKREIRRLKDLGLLRQKRAGVRGRVSAYALDHARIEDMTNRHWPRVNAEFAERMSGAMPMSPANAAPANQPDAIPSAASVPEAAGQPCDSACVWGRAQTLLHAVDRSRYQAWFAPLTREAVSGGRLTLRAPSAFHAGYVRTHLHNELERAVFAVAPDLGAVAVVAP